ncbi:unnamed protein product [Moneuplotes crassus]|uniref:Prefoldin subunit 3 n=1 Tax=Euplotes crassus TaxID=5936 RepID=A0AAD2D560_EUPCR|nr:unnamed protein product [Moneuplotes crassus]
MSEEEKKQVPKEGEIPLTSEGNNARKIPKCEFIEDVETFIEKYKAKETLEAMNELYRKYQFMESQLIAGKKNLKIKLPEIKKTIDMVKLLKEKHEDEVERFNTNFLISDNIWARAEINNSSGKVGLWLGANVMVEQSYDEALALLEKNNFNASKKLESTNEDLDYIKDQITTMEVNMARVYNQNVVNTKKKGGEQATA